MTQAANDLLWAITSPSLVCGDQVAAVAEMVADDIDASSLNAFLATRPAHRVGRYFEHLVHFWLKEVRGVDVVGASVQLREGKRTVGELDFLYRDEAATFVHCEAAIKFFLHHPRPDGSDYPGPNASDDFENKTTKLFERQLPISREHFPDVERREAFVKGMIFYHLDHEPPAERPRRLSPDHLCGWWLRARELERLADRGDVVAAIVSKPFWLAPQVDAQLSEPAQLIGDLREHFDTGRAHPVMLSIRDASTSVEVDRMFAVSDAWPL